MGRLRQPQILNLDEVRAARAYHARQMQRYDDLLAFALEVDKRSKKTEHVVEKVRTRAAAHKSTTTKRSPHPAAVHSRRQRQQTKTQTRPIDLVRRLFAERATETLSLDDIIARAGVSLPAVKGRFNNQVSSEGNTRRAIGLVLQRLTQRGEIKQTAAESYIARKIAIADANGASA